MKTQIIFIFDRSGSMGTVQDTVISGYNEFIDQQKKLATPSDPITMSLTFFDTKCERVFHDVAIDAVAKLTRATYRPDGMTALYDAIVETIKQPVSADRVLCVIQTDGEENSSRRATQHDVADLIKQKTAEGTWTFLYLGADQDAWARAKHMGFAQGNTMSYAGTAVGTQAMMASVAAGTNAYLKSGAQATTRFFTDLSGLDAKQVRRQLDDIRADVTVYPVGKEVEIKPFIEYHAGVPYVPGSAYYQLTKTETIQPDKDLMVMEKTGRAVYAGDDARDVLGFPSGVNARVTPGNHANWDVFVQSKSVNRKLVRGTKLIYTGDTK